MAVALLKKNQDILADSITFPPFPRLPNDVDISNSLGSYYRFTSDHTCVRSRTWCFVGEILQDTSFLRRSFLIKDRAGYEFPLYFYPECGSFDYTTLKEGRTVAIMLAESHCFLDGSIGIRLEDLDTVKVIESNLDDLLEISKCYAKRGGKKCWNEECEEENYKAESLLKCESCKCALYCNKKCQLADWKERHRRWCKALPMFMKMASLDYTKIYSRWE